MTDHPPLPNNRVLWQDSLSVDASEHFRVPLSEVTAEMRQKMKILRHGKNYSFLSSMRSDYNRKGTKPSLSQLIELSKTIKMSAEQQEDQRISFVYGNLKIDNPNITREMVRQVAKNLKNKPKQQEPS